MKNFESQMVQRINATQMFVTLRLLMSNAEKQKCVTYGELQEDVGVSSEDLSRILLGISDFSLTHNLPPLNALVVGAASRKPSNFDFVELHGYEKWEDIFFHCAKFYKNYNRTGINQQVREWQNEHRNKLN